MFTAYGFNFGGRAQSAGFAAILLKDWDARTKASQSAQAIAARAYQHFATYEGAQVVPFLPPPVMELGNASGFDFELENRGGLSHTAFLAARNKLLALAAADPRLVAVRPNGLEDAPQYVLDIDREKADAFGVTNADINTTVQAAFGSAYVNQFTLRGRTKRVFLQGEVSSRMEPSDLNKWFVRNIRGEEVPLSSFIHAEWKLGPQKLEQFNGVPSFEILGQPAAGVSTGTAMQVMQQLAAKLPPAIGYEWTSVSYEQQQTSGQATKLYAVSIVVVLLCLAALYESWPIPFAVMLVVPLGVLGAILATLLRGLNNDIYFRNCSPGVMHPFRPGISQPPFDAATTPRNFLTRSRASRFYASGAAAPRARPTEPPREGRADRGADRSAGAGGQTDRSPRRPYRSAGRADRSARSEAQRTEPATEDSRQFVEAAVTRPKARPPGPRDGSPAA